MARRKKKKNKARFWLVTFLMIVVAFVAFPLQGCYFDIKIFHFWQNDDTLEENEQPSNGELDKPPLDEEVKEDSPSDIVTAELSIHFPMLGNANTGDCTLIKAGDTEILIDAGSKRNSAKAVTDYLSSYCTDGVIEYVIATHAHEDHIAAFVGTTADKTDGVFEKFDFQTIIDFPRTNSNSKLYQEYVALRDGLVEKGVKHYTALECWKEENGAQKTYTIGENISFQILYQRYYEEKASTENDYSVCVLLTQGNNHYLFTGDLEKKGEESLVASNTLPKCKLYKAGHHGSPTSSNDVLLSVIQPEIVCVCCCCGATEYTSNMDNVFPSQAFCDRVAPYTDKIYVTTIYDENAEKEFAPLNGNIVLLSTGGELTVNCSNHNTIFKETDWFKRYRTWNGS